jgi:histidinol-phosphate/aromatic aminotransferase/cobyric acid decarboxylase-like protein
LRVGSQRRQNATVSPNPAAMSAEVLAERKILVKPLREPRLGGGFVRISTATPDENEVLLLELAEVLGGPASQGRIDSSSPPC